MKKVKNWASPESVTVLAIFILSAAALLFLNSLVAQPKLLFGRSLTAITPTLFPMMILIALSAMCIAQLYVARVSDAAAEEVGQSLSPSEWQRGLVFFAIMIGYALIMVPFGFYISSAITMVLLSFLMGSRSILQTACVAGISPALLYLAATRLLAVSLPELNGLELFYSRLLGD